MEELHEKINRYYLYMRDLLRGFLAAAVTDCVIDEHRVSISRAFILQYCQFSGLREGSQARHAMRTTGVF